MPRSVLLEPRHGSEFTLLPLLISLSRDASLPLTAPPPHLHIPDFGVYLLQNSDSILGCHEGFLSFSHPLPFVSTLNPLRTPKYIRKSHLESLEFISVSLGETLDNLVGNRYCHRSLTLAIDLLMCLRMTQTHHLCFNS